MHLGIEIGGTKLQLGIGRGDGTPLVTLERFDVDLSRGALGILERIAATGDALIARHGVQIIGIGFGGPVDQITGRTVKSHQVSGWEDFPLVAWARETFKRPVAIGNDADLAGLAEARFGGGRGRSPVFYVTVGTGVGGGLIIDGQVYRGGGLGAAEIGHLRPGLHADRPDNTVESIASGTGIAAAAQARLSEPFSHQLRPFLASSKPPGPDAVRQHLIAAEEADEEYAADLRERCEGDVELLSAKIIGQAATDGNGIALEVLHHACQTLGWGIAQMITLLAPQVVVLGGGVSLLGEQLFLGPVRTAVDLYVFPPFRGTFSILPAKLGEEMVVHGALAIAADLPA